MVLEKERNTYFVLVPKMKLDLVNRVQPIDQWNVNLNLPPPIVLVHLLLKMLERIL
ncbi:unnamed protein product [Trichobilharzia regenti]|nr:unnamed protein product [Trichobilharzia regenti]